MAVVFVHKHVYVQTDDDTYLGASKHIEITSGKLTCTVITLASRYALPTEGVSEHLLVLSRLICSQEKYEKKKNPAVRQIKN